MHDILLSPPPELNAPAILQRRDEDFIAAVLEALRDETKRGGLNGSLAKARTKEGVLKLFQPVQREFHLAIFEASCDQPGRPRLDPARVAAAGLVVRRRRHRPELEGVCYEGWMHMRSQLRGWLAVDCLGETEADPISDLRRARKATGVAHLDRALAARNANLESGLLEEHVVPMFPAPPEVCQAADRTFFYGLIPTTSSETAAGPASLAAALGPNAQPFGAGDEAFLRHLAKGLRGEAIVLPLAGEMMQAAWYDAVEMPSAGRPEGMAEEHWAALWPPEDPEDSEDPESPAARMREFIALLRQLSHEFDAFGEKPESEEICKLLAEIPMPLHSHSPSPVGTNEFLRQAAALLLENQPDAPTPKMPERWPALEDGLTKRLQNALAAAFQARFPEVTGPPGRYDEPGAEYVIRAFVREKPNGGCPGRIHWSDYSVPFVIAPWYEGDGAPPTLVTLPDLRKLSTITPNVAFVVPSTMHGLMSGDPKDMLDGKFDLSALRTDASNGDENNGDGSNGNGSNGDGSGINWICSFNIPVITFCAFLVLNLFLKLFSLVIRLALSVSVKLPSIALKLCLPFPKKN